MTDPKHPCPYCGTNGDGLRRRIRELEAEVERLKAACKSKDDGIESLGRKLIDTRYEMREAVEAARREEREAIRKSLHDAPFAAWLLNVSTEDICKAVLQQVDEHIRSRGCRD